MNIQEAVKMAIKERALIYRKCAGWSRSNGRRSAILPTNSYDTCIIKHFVNGEEQRSCRHWNPTADDLMADDWETLRMISHKKDISSEKEISESCEHRGDGYPYSIIDKYYLPISESKREEIQNVKTFNWAWMVFVSMITALITILLSTVLVRL
ncbi:Thoeris anti-defense Tad2 family protein [Diplocloster hominis]|uniref:Thoeris anti-defense Tad2 family protein n=1 Tax=Diplocloster hominis TaxID=3079010 RepID=UPI0031BA3105